jgi:hypothetical protein
MQILMNKLPLCLKTKDDIKDKLDKAQLDS